MSNYDVVDNFLPDDEFNQLSSFMLGSAFPWYHSDNVAEEGNDEAKVSYNHYFTHNLVLPAPVDTPDGTPPQVSHLHEPIWYDHFDQRFPDVDIIRMKVNCFPATDKVYEHITHTDYDFPHKGALLCLNTCNGYTRIGDDKIPSIANRMIYFDTSAPHCSTTTSDQPMRCNIVINYKQRTSNPLSLICP